VSISSLGRFPSVGDFNFFQFYQLHILQVDKCKMATYFPYGIDITADEPRYVPHSENIWSHLTNTIAPVKTHGGVVLDIRIASEQIDTVVANSRQVMCTVGTGLAQTEVPRPYLGQYFTAITPDISPRTGVRICRILRVSHVGGGNTARTMTAAVINVWTMSSLYELYFRLIYDRSLRRWRWHLNKAPAGESVIWDRVFDSELY